MIRLEMIHPRSIASTFSERDTDFARTTQETTSLPTSPCSLAQPKSSTSLFRRPPRQPHRLQSLSRRGSSLTLYEHLASSSSLLPSFRPSTAPNWSLFPPKTIPVGLHKLGKLNHVAIATSDIKKTTAFYRDVLGGKVSAPTVCPTSSLRFVLILDTLCMVSSIGPHYDAN